MGAPKVAKKVVLLLDGFIADFRTNYQGEDGKTAIRVETKCGEMDKFHLAITCSNDKPVAWSWIAISVCPITANAVDTEMRIDHDGKAMFPGLNREIRHLIMVNISPPPKSGRKSKHQGDRVY